MYFLTLWNMPSFVVLFRVFGIPVSIAFRTFIEYVAIRVSVFKAFFCSSRSLDGISRYISLNFLLFLPVNAQLNQFNYRNLEMLRNDCTYSRLFCANF